MNQLFGTDQAAPVESLAVAGNRQAPTHKRRPCRVAETALRRDQA
jgi:hypothetical protein